MYRVNVIYETLEIWRPEKLDCGMAVWTVIDETYDSDTILCVNPAVNDSRDLRLPLETCPEEMAGSSLFTEARNINPEITDIPVRVIIRHNFGGHLEGWIRTWSTDLSEFKKISLFDDHTGEEAISRSGTRQTIDPDTIMERSEVFNKSDIRGFKNDLIK